MMTDRVWHRKEPQGDAWDQVVIHGMFGGVGEEREVVVSPLSFGPCISCPPEALKASYAPAAPVEVERVEERLEELARG